MSAPSSERHPQPADSSEAPDPRAQRYSFSRFVRDAWSHLRGAALPLLVVFVAAHVVAALLPYLVRSDVPAALGYPLVFLFRVVVPIVLGSVAVAIGTVLALSREPEGSAAAQPGLVPATRQVLARKSDVIVLSLVASFMGIGGVLLLGAYGFLVLHLFYGPPVATQLAMTEGLGYRDALRRARAMLRGNWRMVLYLLNVALGIGALSLLVLDLFVRLMGVGADPVARVSLGVVQGVVLGALTTFIAGAQVAVYRYLEGRYAGAGDPEPAQGPAVTEKDPAPTPD